MTETNAERVLERLAFGDDWKLDSLGKLIAAVEGVQRKLQGIIDALPQQWQGDTAELALARFRVHQGNLGKYSDALFQAQALVTGQGKSTCSATCANTTRAAEAQRLLSELPSGLVPPWVHDKVNQGGVANIPGIGKFDINSHMEDISNLFGENRKKAAEQALVSMSKVITSEAERLRIVVAYDELPISTFPPETEEVAPFEGLSDVPRGGTGESFPGGFNRPGGSGGLAPYDPSGTLNPEGSGGGNSNWPSGGPGPATGGPEWISGGGGDSGNGGNGGSGGNGGGSGSGGNGDGSGSRGPSVDSNLDGGSSLRPALGAAGLGAVGLAAGAKIASGSGSGLSGLGGAFGGAGGAGGVGAGGGGLRGAAAAAGSGGAGSGAAGANAAAGAAKGGRPGGMMMGGGGAGGANGKKGKRVGLGYIAPTLEDEGDGGPAANASRGGSRGGN